MGRRIPSDEEVLEASRRVLQHFPTVVSQRKMGRLVAAELQRTLEGSGVTGDRVRRLLLHVPFARVEYRTRDDDATKPMYSCPICGAQIKRLKNQTLFGGEVSLTIRCPNCKYWSGRHRRLPTLYTFHRRT